MTTPTHLVQKVRMEEANFFSHQIRLIVIDRGYFRFMPVDTVAGTKVWRLRVANVWVVTASGMCYCSNILTVATLGLCLLTQLMAQQCGV